MINDGNLSDCSDVDPEDEPDISNVINNKGLGVGTEFSYISGTDVINKTVGVLPNIEIEFTRDELPGDEPDLTSDVSNNMIPCELPIEFPNNELPHNELDVTSYILNNTSPCNESTAIDIFNDEGLVIDHTETLTTTVTDNIVTETGESLSSNKIKRTCVENAPNVIPDPASKEKKTMPKWQNKDIEPVNSICEYEFPEPPDDDITPYEYFKMFCDDSMVKNISYQTNIYSVEKLGKSLNTTPNEIEQFIGIHIMSGIVRTPAYRLYWASGTRYDAIADIMSRNRFEKLRNYIHINDNSNIKPVEDVNHDKLFKVRPFLDSFNNNLKQLPVEECNAVDEMMIPFKGRSSLKQYMQNKPHKWGIKIFARAGSSGIVYDTEIYVGKTTAPATGLGISGDIVIRLSENLPKNENYKLYTDNWFTSYHLLAALKEKGLHGIGTVRSNRLPGVPFQTDKNLKSEGRGACEVFTDVRNNIAAVKWFDNRCVHVASTYAGKEPLQQSVRWSVADKKHVNVPSPAAVAEYNRGMGGVDLHNMLVELYRIDIRARRYYVRIIWHLIDMCCVNGWLVYRRHMKQKNNKKYMALKDFKANIGNALLKAGKTIIRKRGRPSLSPAAPEQPAKQKKRAPRPNVDVQYDQIGHWAVHIEPKQRCRHCVKAYARQKCIKCNVSLCFTKDRNCFYNFHNKE